MKIETPATIVQCLPGARTPDILANSKVLANGNVNSVRLLFTLALMMFDFASQRSLKITFKEMCKLECTISDTVIWSGPLPAYQGDEIHSRLSSLDGWMSKWCLQNNRFHRQFDEVLGQT